MTDKEKALLWLSSFVKNKEPMTLIPKQLIRLIYDVLKKQEQKTGHWKISEYEYLDCSCCGNSYYTGCDSTEEAKTRLKEGFYFKYCPYCGAKMEGSTNT